MLAPILIAGSIAWIVLGICIAVVAIFRGYTIRIAIPALLSLSLAGFVFGFGIQLGGWPMFIVMFAQWYKLVDGLARIFAVIAVVGVGFMSLSGFVQSQKLLLLGWTTAMVGGVCFGLCAVILMLFL